MNSHVQTSTSAGASTTTSGRAKNPISTQFSYFPTFILFFDKNEVHEWGNEKLGSWSVFAVWA